MKWYRQHRRTLPWRSHQGRAQSPYHTWISEIMLQQTGVSTVIPYFNAFTDRWPTVENLAAASQDDVLARWAGLGYYSRARNLLKCAQVVVGEHGGEFPDDIEVLKKLPGIGDYTANAIRAIAFDKPANVVDGNVERVMSRMFAIREPINTPAMKKEIKRLAGTLAPEKDAGDYAQGLMELGATICTPKNPDCGACPWQEFCLARKSGLQNELPVIPRAKKNPERFASVVVLRDKTGRVFLRQRPDSGLLGGLWECVGTEWRAETPSRLAELRTILGADFELKKLPQHVAHVFSHFKLTTTIYTCPAVAASATKKLHGSWFKTDELPPLSTLTQKILKAATAKAISK